MSKKSKVRKESLKKQETKEISDEELIAQTKQTLNEAKRLFFL